jgi:hypothetical protein
MLTWRPAGCFSRDMEPKTLLTYLHSELLGFWILSVVRYSKKTLKDTTFRKLDLFPSSDEGAGNYSVGSVTKS